MMSALVLGKSQTSLFPTSPTLSPSEHEDDHLLVTKRRLADDFNKSGMSFIHCRGEDLAEMTPANSADIILAAECLVLMDPSEGLRSFAKVLKPSGALAT